MKKSWLVMMLPFVMGCSLMSGTDIAAVAKELKESSNSFCLEIVGTGGGITIPVPGTVPTGAMYYGRVTVGRAAEGQSLECGEDGVKVEGRSNETFIVDSNGNPLLRLR